LTIAFFSTMEVYRQLSDYLNPNISQNIFFCVQQRKEKRPIV